jgi:NAD(P)H-hydrate epimerase
LKILNASQIREADKYTIENEPISSIDLMERAASRATKWILRNYFEENPSSHKVHVFCGMGNNGGDGLVLARQLDANDVDVKVWLVHFSDNQSEDFKENLDRIHDSIEIVDLKDDFNPSDIQKDDLVIDAIFGTGLSRPPEGIAGDVIMALNSSDAEIVSIDMPSGLYDEDNSKNDYKRIINARHTLTFQNPKLSFFLAENEMKVGEVHVLDIGLSQEFINSIESSYQLVDDEMARALHRKRNTYSHKGTFGHALLVGGSEGKWGAIALAARACLKSGAGLLTVHTAIKGIDIVHQGVNEAMLNADPENEFISEIPDLAPYKVIGVGPGIGKKEETQRAFKRLIQNSPAPLVIDADALNILAENKTWMAFLPAGSILTPHPGEFSRLADFKGTHYDAIQKQIELSRKHNIYILLKGAHSTVTTPNGQIFVNSTGNPGMASAGMGDTLTGIVTGLMSSGYTSAESAVLGMYIHGKAGDLALENESVESLIASDLTTYLGRAFQGLANYE